VKKQITSVEWMSKCRVGKNQRPPKNPKMAGITAYLSTVILNVNSLTSPIKRHRLENQIKKEDPSICYLLQSSSH
jgi:hypothetical protein